MRAAQSAALLQRRVDEIGAGLSTTARDTGRQRLAAVAERVRLRCTSLDL